MKIVQEFKEFALKGNVMDMAVGVIIGGAFGKIISSLVDDIIMPLVGKLVGNVNFTDMYIGLSGQGNNLPIDDAKAAGAVFAYGQFLQNVIDFLIIAFCIFLMIKGMNSLKRKMEKKQEEAPAAPPAPTKEEELLTEIRDLLKEKK